MPSAGHSSEVYEMAQMVMVRNTGAAAMVNGLLLLEDETREVAAGLVAGLQTQYPQLVVATPTVVASEPVEPSEPVDAVVESADKPKAKAKKK